jgi:hypothetical protein
MGEKLAKYSAVLIGTYLVVFYATGASKDLTAATGFVTGTTRAFQGR